MFLGAYCSLAIITIQAALTLTVCFLCFLTETQGGELALFVYASMPARSALMNVVNASDVDINQALH